MTIATPNRHGFTLLELLCVMALLSVLGVVFGILLKQTLDVERAQAAGFNRLLQNKALADQFRADVARADKAPDAWQQHAANAQTLILQMKEGDHVVYAWRKGELIRESIDASKLVVRPLPLGPGGRLSGWRRPRNTEPPCGVQQRLNSPPESGPWPHHSEPRDPPLAPSLARSSSLSRPSSPHRGSSLPPPDRSAHAAALDSHR